MVKQIEHDCVHDIVINGVHIRIVQVIGVRFKVARILGLEKYNLLHSESSLACRDIKMLRGVIMELVNRARTSIAEPIG